MSMKLIIELLRVWGVAVKAAIQWSYGVVTLYRLRQPIVAVFGGQGAYEKGKYAQWAYDFSAQIAQEGMSVITGGGPGIMEAANCGAYEASDTKKGITLGIRVTNVDTDFTNKYAPIITVDYFFIRKWLLTRYACCFVFFPGGIGTVDELFEVLNLMKLERMSQLPVILVGKEYWSDLIAWYKHAHDRELITVSIEKAVLITDDIGEAVEVIVRSCRTTKK